MVGANEIVGSVDGRSKLFEGGRMSVLMDVGLWLAAFLWSSKFDLLARNALGLK